MTAMPPRTTRVRQVATVLLDCYPRRWRARYGVEMHAMVDAMPVTWRQVADLAVGAVREWLSPRAVGWPARSAAGRVLQLCQLRFMLVPVAFEGIAHGTMAWTSRPIEVPWLGSVATALVLAGLVRCALAYGHATTTRWDWLARQRWLSSCNGLEVAFWFAVIGVWVAFIHVRPVPADISEPIARDLTWHFYAFFWATLLYRASAHTQRLLRVEFVHLRRLNATRHDLFRLPTRLGRP